MYYNGYRWQPPAQNQMVMPQQMEQQQQQMMQQQFPQMPQQQMLGLKGRLVSSIDEVRATPVDMDGSETYFPHPASNSIYTKSIDMNGNQVIRRYVLDKDNGTDNNSLDANFTELEKRVKSLEELLEGLTGGSTEK